MSTKARSLFRSVFVCVTTVALKCIKHTITNNIVQPFLSRHQCGYELWSLVCHCVLHFSTFAHCVTSASHISAMLRPLLSKRHGYNQWRNYNKLSQSFNSLTDNITLHVCINTWGCTVLTLKIKGCVRQSDFRALPLRHGLFFYME